MFILTLLPIPTAMAATLDVPGGYPTVQAAVDGATSGDTIRVTGGTFSGGVVVDKNLTIEGAGMRNTVLTGGAGDFVVSLADGVDVTLRSLSVDGAGARGCINVNPGANLDTFELKLKSAGSTQRWGAALRLELATADVRRTVICDAQGDAVADTVRGSVYVIEGSSADISESVFFGNSMDALGGALYVKGGATVTNSVFLGNSAPLGAAVYVESPGSLDFVNNIVAENEAGAGVKAAQYAVFDAPGSMTGGNNLYFDNVDDDTNSPLGGDLVGMQPSFANPTVDCGVAAFADFALLPGSPAIDAGAPSGVFDDIGAVEFVDLDGDGFAAGFGDCDDADGMAYPGAPEVLADGVDQDCDGMEGCYLDEDEDGDRSETVITGRAPGCVGADEALASQPIDCNDQDPLQGSGIPEFLCDGVDNDCNEDTPDDDGFCATGDTGTPADTDTDVDTDTDTDVDTDTDSDVDTDTDADTDTDTDTGETGGPSVAAPSGTAVDGCGCHSGGSRRNLLWPWARR